jgi:RNA polymerase sigma-70 factor (ECF subfamily)
MPDLASYLELITAMNSGDEAAFHVLYHRYRDWVVSLARRFTGCDSQANDVMQETFLYFLKKFPGFVLTSQLKTFLYPAVRNLSLTAIGKARKLQTGSDENGILETLAAPEAIPGAGDDFDFILSELSEDHRETLMLRFVDGLSLAEIAAACGVPLGTVKSRLHHALARLREDPRTREFFFE